MHEHLARRLPLVVPTLFGVTVLIFLAMVAGEQATSILKEDELKAARASLGLDKPCHEQYLDWMRDVARGDPGRSFWRNEPIREIILRRGPITVQLAVMAVTFSWLIGLPVGMLGAVWRRPSVPHGGWPCSRASPSPRQSWPPNCWGAGPRPRRGRRPA